LTVQHKNRPARVLAGAYSTQDTVIIRVGVLIRNCRGQTELSSDAGGSAQVPSGLRRFTKTESLRRFTKTAIYLRTSPYAPAEFSFREGDAFQHLLKGQLCFRPAKAGKQLVKRFLGAFTMQFDAVQAVVEIEEVAVDLPVIGTFASRENPRTVWLEQHPRQNLERGCRLFPGASEGLTEEIDVEFKHRNKGSSGILVADLFVPEGLLIIAQ